MQITVNGQAREVLDGLTVAELLRGLGVPGDGVAVAVDREVVPRSAHASTALRGGAQVEVLVAVGGG